MGALKSIQGLNKMKRKRKDGFTLPFLSLLFLPFPYSILRKKKKRTFFLKAHKIEL